VKQGNTFLDRRSTRKGDKRKFGIYVFLGLVVAVLFLLFIYLPAYVDIYFRERYGVVNYSPVLIISGLLYLLLTLVWTTWPGKFKVKPNIKNIRIELRSAFVLISGGLLLHLTGPVYKASFSEILVINTAIVSLIIIYVYRQRRRR
jgi:O-antigen/teichoic acid export membrane protein